MARISPDPPPDARDGTSQRGRERAALDPAGVPIDERSSADLLRYVMAYVRRLRFHAAGDDGSSVVDAGDWAELANPGPGLELTADDVAAYAADPDAFEGARRDWLGRPHFALLLAFIELLGKSRERLNLLTERHLDHHYREVLRLLPEPAEPDRANVLFRLAPRAGAVLLPAGTALDGGRDAGNVTRIYRTERDCLVNHAGVAELRSVFVDRQAIGLEDVRLQGSLTVAVTVDRMLALALGEPGPGGAIPAWRGQAIGHAWLSDPAPATGLQAILGLCREDRGLHLTHDELRTLMRLVRRREAGVEWPRINALMGNAAPPDPRDFAANFADAIAPEILDFKQDGLPDIGTLDDFYEHRDDPGVRAVMADKLKNLGPPGADGYEAFASLMPLKQAVDRDWANVNALLEAMGRRRLNDPGWVLLEDGADPSDFPTHLARALGTPPAWPWGTASLPDFEARLRELEGQIGLAAERIDELAALVSDAALAHADNPAWRRVDLLLADAHRERVYTRRRAELDRLRMGAADMAAFDAVVRGVLKSQLHADQPPPTWAEARALLADAGQVPPGSLAALDGFRSSLGADGTLPPLDWPGAIELLERAWRIVENLPEPVAQVVHWRHLHPWPDARQALAEAGSPRWKTFGRSAPDTDTPPPPALGWMLCAPLLGLAEGTRTITVTIGLEAASFDRSRFLGDLFAISQPPPVDLRGAIAAAWVVELSGTGGWIAPEILGVALASGAPGDDYWSLDRLGRPPGQSDRPALQLVLRLAPDKPPVAAGPGQDTPCLRVLLRPYREGGSGPWATALQPFEPLRIAAARLAVEVGGLRGLQLQHDDRPLDARKPFEPFGSRPAPGAGLLFSHPELVRERLDRLALQIDWSGLPTDPGHYQNYPPPLEGSSGPIESFTLDVTLLERGLELSLGQSTSVAFAADTGPSAVELQVVQRLQAQYPAFSYARWPGLGASDDLRDAGRCWRLDLPTDLGHAVYPAVAARRAAELAVDILRGDVPAKHAVSEYQVNPPYTPLVRRLLVDYTASIELHPGQADAPGQWRHSHPFGSAALDAAEPWLMPRYDAAGELYIGLRGLEPPQTTSLLLQLAEGTSNPDLPPANVQWSCQDGDGWRRVEVIDDGTRGLVNSGIVQLALPAATPGSLLPGGLYWVRAAVDRSTAGVCDCVDIHAQAAAVRFEDRGNAASHYAQPLAAGSIKRLVVADARIASVQQPYTSFGGRPPEAIAGLRTRASERLRHRQRALAPWDVEHLVLQRFRQVFKCKCLPAAPAPGSMTVIVVPDIRGLRPADALAPKLPANLLDDIRDHLLERAAAGSRVLVRNARFVPVRLRLSVRFAAGQDEAHSLRRLNEDLVRFLSPWAYDEAAELMIGGRVFANSVVDFVDRRDYVDYVGPVKLFRVQANGDAVYVAPPDAGAVDGYHVATEGPDEILVAASAHDIDPIPEAGLQQAQATGIDYMKVELDFVVHA